MSTAIDIILENVKHLPQNYVNEKPSFLLVAQITGIIKQKQTSYNFKLPIT